MNNIEGFLTSQNSDLSYAIEDLYNDFQNGPPHQKILSVLPCQIDIRKMLFLQEAWQKNQAKELYDAFMTGVITL